MFGTPARGGRLEGADDSTELWRHPTAPLTNDPSLFSIRNDDGDNGNEYDFEFFSTSFWQQKSISLNFFVALICPPQAIRHKLLILSLFIFVFVFRFRKILYLHFPAKVHSCSISVPSSSSIF